MSLNDLQKNALARQLLELINHDEPAAFLATLQRMAERQASHEARKLRKPQTFSQRPKARA